MKGVTKGIRLLFYVDIKSRVLPNRPQQPKD